MLDWTYPEKPSPGAESDEWLAWYEIHTKWLENHIALLRHDRDVLAENMRDIRDAVFRLGTNAQLQRYNEDRMPSQEDARRNHAFTD